jgi:hypothetical protein
VAVCAQRSVPPGKPETMEVTMASKNVRKESRKKQTRTLKEKRAAKKAKNGAQPIRLIPPTDH